NHWRDLLAVLRCRPEPSLSDYARSSGTTEIHLVVLRQSLVSIWRQCASPGLAGKFSTYHTRSETGENQASISGDRASFPRKVGLLPADNDGRTRIRWSSGRSSPATSGDCALRKSRFDAVRPRRQSPTIATYCVRTAAVSVLISQCAPFTSIC